MNNSELPNLCYMPGGIDSTGDIRLIKTDEKGKVLAILESDEIDRIVTRLIERLREEGIIRL